MSDLVPVPEPEVIVRMKHIRQLKLCAGGAREWFAVNNLSWVSFLAKGIGEKELIATGDTLWVPRVIELARKEP